MPSSGKQLGKSLRIRSLPGRSHPLLQDCIKKLRMKALEAVNRRPGPEPTLTPTELDHMNGKTRLIADEMSPSSPPPNSSSSGNASPPPDSSSGGMSTAPFVLDSELMNMDNIHPRILQDMRTFDGFDVSSFHLQTRTGDFLFDLPPDSSTSPKAITDAQYQDSIYGGDLFHQQPTGGMVQGHTPTTPGFSPGPPMLDVTWQSFVEQLGF